METSCVLLGTLELFQVAFDWQCGAQASSLVRVDTALNAKENTYLRQLRSVRKY